MRVRKSFTYILSVISFNLTLFFGRSSQDREKPFAVSRLEVLREKVVLRTSDASWESKQKRFLPWRLLGMQSVQYGPCGQGPAVPFPTIRF